MMLDLAYATAGTMAGDRVTLIEGTGDDAPAGPFDAATCILVDQCIDRAAPDVDLRLIATPATPADPVSIPAP